MSVGEVGSDQSPHAGIGDRTSPTGEETSDDAGLTQSVIYSVISNDRRRYVLRVLREESREVYLREMAERVAAWENDESVEAVTTQERRRVETALRQFHLPKMDDAGFVTYNDRRKTVRLAVPASAFTDYLDPQPAENYRWNAIATMIGVGSILALVASQSFAGVGPAIASTALLLVGTVLLSLGAFYG